MKNNIQVILLAVAALLIITILVRYVPIIPIHRTAKEMGILPTDKTEKS